MSYNGVVNDSETNLKLSREQSFFDKSRSIKWLIILAFFLATFAMLHFREVRVDVLEINSIAPRYIVAQVDFEFRDEEASNIIKQEAVRDIGKIYKISEREIRMRRTEFEKGLINNLEWRKHINESAFGDVYHAIDHLTKILTQLRFTDLRTLQKMQEFKLPTADNLVFSPGNTTQPLTLPLQIWEYIEAQLKGLNHLSPDSIQFMIDQYKDYKWMLEEDIPAQRVLRKRVQASIPETYSFVSAGNRIIDKGEKVTARHIAMLQAMKQVLSERRNLWNPLTLLGSFILTLIFTSIIGLYFKIYHSFILESNRTLFLVVIIVLLTYIFSKVVEFILLNSNSNLFEIIHHPLFIPFAAILSCSLLNAGIATVITGFLTVMLTLTLSFDRTGFMTINLTAALVAILSMRNMHHRKDIFTACFKAWLICIASVIAMHFYENTLWSSLMLMDIVSSGVFMLFTAIVVIGLLPLLESSFHVMTDSALMEYLDPNLELVRRLSIEAPGTYQHSLVVGNIAESAAQSIGANGLFCRVAALFHDIGKMTIAQYFTENQQGAMNIHQLLTPLESAHVIMSHVSEGVSLARKAHLPEQFIDIIKEHHGTTLVYYFYRKQLDLVGGDKKLVDEKEFRYPGPKPRTKESAIIMIADSLEAASRSLDIFNEETLTLLVRRLIRDKADDGQFDDCLLTFEELSVIKKTMVKTLLASGHSRVKYPVIEE